MAVELDLRIDGFRVVDRPHVQEIPADAVPADTRRLAEMALTVAREELGLDDDVRLRWFGKESETSTRLRRKHGTKGLPWRTFEADDDVQGITFGAEPSELWIRSTRDPLDAVECVLHEARHSQQYADYVQGKAGARNMASTSPCADGLAEADARIWVREILQTLDRELDEHEAEVARTTARTVAIPARKSRVDAGHTEFQCEHCDGWMRVGVTHTCPAARRWR